MRARGNGIVLIGFMGAGKSSVGPELATRLELPLHDIDSMAAGAAGCTISEIFAREGEAGFRVRETAALAELREEPAIVVTGGGIVVAPANIEALRRLGMVVYLSANEETLWRRTGGGDRPLLQTTDARAVFSHLLKIREPLYRATADFVVDTSPQTLPETVETLLNLLQDSCHHHAS